MVKSQGKGLWLIISRLPGKSSCLTSWPALTEVVVAMWNIFLPLSAVLTGDSKALLGPLAYFPLEYFFTPAPFWTLENVRVLLFSLAALERASFFCSYAPFRILEFYSFPALWTLPRGQGFFSSVQQSLTFLPFCIWSRGSPSHLGAGRTLTHWSDVHHVFFLWPCFLSWKIINWGFDSYSLQFMMSSFPICCCFSGENMKVYEEIWGENKLWWTSQK